MKIKLLAIGKTDNKQLTQLIDEYKNRLKHYIKFELEMIPDIKNVNRLFSKIGNQSNYMYAAIFKRFYPSLIFSFLSILSY